MGHSMTKLWHKVRKRKAHWGHRLLVGLTVDAVYRYAIASV